MTDEFFQWRIEKRRLANFIREFGIEEGIDEWFQQSVFQLQTEHLVDEYGLKAMNDLKEFGMWELRMMGVKLGSEIVSKKGMYIEQIENRKRFMRLRRITIFVLGRPQFIQDNKNGKLAYIRDSTL